MQFGSPSRKRLEIAAVSVIVLCATLLCAFWTLRFPMFQQPDEIAHADAAFAYFDAGHPFTVERPTITSFVTPQTRYLMLATRYRALRYNKYAATRNGYGSFAYFRRLDADAPQPSNVVPGAHGRVPYVLAFYPSVFYYAVAATMRAGWNASGHSLSAAFFAGRFLNVAYFALTMIAGYAVLLEYRFSATQRLMLLTGVAFFPLATWMGSYIQPDNQSALVMTISLYCTLVLRKRPGSLLALSGLAIAECVLGVTKLQFAIVAILAMAVALRGAFDGEPPVTRLRAVVLSIAVPIMMAFLGRFVSPIGGLTAPPVGTAYAHVTVLEQLKIASADVMQTLINTFLGGPTFAGFWFHFGLRAGGAFPRDATGAVTTSLTILTLLTLAAWILAQVRFVRRLRPIAKRYSIARAIKFAGVDPALNAYILLSTILVLISASTNGDLMLQGRYWYPVLFPIVIISARSFGAALPKVNRRLATSMVCSFWLCYSLIAAPCAVVAMENDFYHSHDASPDSELGQIEAVAVDGRSVDRNNLVVMSPSVITVNGDAIDTSVGLPARDIRFKIDAGADRRSLSLLPDRALVVIFNDRLLAYSGFRFNVPTRQLSPGRHEIKIAAFETRAPYGLRIDTLRFNVRLGRKQ